MEHFDLQHGDCFELLQAIDDESIDLTVTSPPYYNAREYSQYESLEDYMNTMEKIFSLVFHKTKESRIVAINISPVIVPRESRSKQSYRIPLPYYYVPMMEKIGFEFLEDIIWRKPDGSAINRNGGFFRHRKPLAYKPNIVTEYLLVFKKPSSRLIDKFLKNDSLVEDGYERTNVWDVNPETSSQHAAPFPVEIPRKLIQYYSYEKDVVLDPFMGSGTTGVACSGLDRAFIGMEQDQTYFELAAERIGYDKYLNWKELFCAG